jgi:beta-apo-4'-carotenal oxygenase
MVCNEIVNTSNKLETWVKDESAKDAPLTLKPLGPKIRRDPLGLVLIIG